MLLNYVVREGGERDQERTAGEGRETFSSSLEKTSFTRRGCQGRGHTTKGLYFNLDRFSKFALHSSSRDIRQGPVNFLNLDISEGITGGKQKRFGSKLGGVAMGCPAFVMPFIRLRKTADIISPLITLC